MTLQPGIYIKSTPLLNETNFEHTTIFIAAYNSNGATGFIIDQPFGRNLNGLEEFKNSPDFPLYTGGPVDREHLFFVHRRPDIIQGGTTVDGIYFSGNFGQAVAAINNNTLTANDIKIFVGYCGWDAGELEAEIAEGSWTIAQGIENIFMR